ncbi:uncharacterized protein PV09_06586 [Verruconis gallopava]|uniref:Cytochrome P450 n=1 Tax=Verruconis gallopava TaxID=253628 RepID=A0A0D1XIG1_9PEZI|nr:uncharacterized protein PV09_06586 [Verruconis gallopava]KIW02096.1 hypothetical protein PV09_06586 [Verruconis gallopava]
MVDPFSGHIWPMLPSLLTLGMILIVLTLLFNTVYNVYFHPLHGFPGPRIAAATSLYYIYWNARGERHKIDLYLHMKYGEVVRVKPNQLSFVGDDAWKDIFMHRQGHPQMAKYGRGNSNTRGAHSLVSAPDDIHARQRKCLSHAFSEKALREQEPLIKSYIDILISSMREDALNGRPSDMVKYFNWISFDVVGDLAFAQSFDALRTRSTHPWIKAFFAGLKLRVILGEIINFPILRPMIFLAMRIRALKGRKSSNFCRAAVKRRYELGDLNRPDFLGKVMQKNAEKDRSAHMSEDEINMNFTVIMVAGSETTATLLSGCTFLLHKNPEVLKKLKAEVRSSFKSEDEINMITVNKLPYLLAVIEEALRYYPPIAIALPRKSPPHGTTICGHHVPGNVVVGIPPWAANHSPNHFVHPDEFIPERFLPNKEERFSQDRTAIHQPFSAGPRNCLGRNLANAEIRLILARIIYNFDMELVDQKSEWMTNQKSYIIWSRPKLMVLSKATT